MSRNADADRDVYRRISPADRAWLVRREQSARFMAATLASVAVRRLAPAEGSQIAPKPFKGRYGQFRACLGTYIFDTHGS